MAEKTFDLVVIGGGIHGVGVAQAAAAGGHSVVVLEKESLASGTSGRSSKLIHGGLRYLESAELSLVRECLLERHLLLKNAPHLVSLKKFNIPVYSATTRRPITLWLGLFLYYALSGFNKESAFRIIPKEDWGSLDGITTDDLQMVFQYHDAQTDDILLTKAVMSSALELGAELRMPAELTSAVFENGGWTVNFEEGGKPVQIRSNFLVNAGGPWANMILEKISPGQELVPVDLVQGSHIVIEGQITNGLYYLEAPRDKRAVFVMPWYGKTLIGTTETVYEGDPSDVIPLDDEINYLLETASRYFPRFSSLGWGDVVDSFAGLRVLPSGDGLFFHRSRETLLHGGSDVDAKLLSVYGGKLTSYRGTAEKVMKTISPLLPPAKKIADTKKIKL